MSESRIRVRANRSTGELEIEGSPQAVSEWWDRLWPELGRGSANALAVRHGGDGSDLSPDAIPTAFGEYFSQFSSDLTDVDRILIAGAFVQSTDSGRTFTTKAANQLLLDQNVKLANASQSARRLVEAKRAFVVSEGNFRVSVQGFEHIKSLRSSQ